MATSGNENRFTLRPFGQEDSEQDYQILHRLSNFQVPQDPKGNAEWLQNRRLYDEANCRRRHYIAIHQATQEPVGYASLEQQGPNQEAFRLYLVFDPNRWAFAALGEFLYQRLLQDAQELDAVSLILIEYANDLAFLNFLRAHGFIEVGTTTYNGFAIVRMEKRLVG